MGNVIEVMYRTGSFPVEIPVRRIDADHYEDLRTGEVKEYTHIENRGQDLQGVARSLGRLRDLLNTNIVDVSHCRWVTLTYAENMRDPKRLYADFKEFNRRMRKRVGNYEYITAAEPQGRGAWHLHVVMLFPDRAPFIPNEDVSAAWRQGFVKIKRLDDVDNVGAYLTCYLGDMELNEALAAGVPLHELVKGFDGKLLELEDESGEKVEKCFIKGARLRFYPPDFNLYRFSRGCKKPEVLTVSEKWAKEKVSAATLTFEKTLCLTDTEADWKHVLNYRYYNKARKECKV